MAILCVSVLILVSIGGEWLADIINIEIYHFFSFIASFANDDIVYYLYNKNTGASNPSTITLGSVEKANLDPSKPLKILCHGYLDGIDSTWYAATVSAYLESQDVNIIAIDWPATALYSSTVSTAKEVATVNGELIQELYEKLGLDLNNVHFIGHSLGAHIAGLTGYTENHIFKTNK